MSSASAGERLPGTPEPMHRWKGYGNVTIAGDSWGNDDDPPVLLLHGAGQTRHSWTAVGRRLAEAGYRAIALDARGHGDSSWSTDGDYSSDSMIQDLKCVIAEIGKENPAIVGASMGGRIGLIAIGEGRVESSALVLVDIAAHIEKSGADRVRAFMGDQPEGFGSLEDVADAIARYQPHRRRPSAVGGLVKNVRLGDDGRYHWHWDPAYWGRVRDPENEARRLSASSQGLRLPVLLIRGGLSDVLTEEGVEDFLELCPHAEYVNVAGAAHMIVGDRNDVFSGAVADFLHRMVPTHQS